MNKEQDASLHSLMTKYSGNTISREELDQLLKMIRSEAHADELNEALRLQWEEAKQMKQGSGIDWDSKLNALFQQSIPMTPSTKTSSHKRWYRLSAAAILMIALGTTAYYSTRPATPVKAVVLQTTRPSTPATQDLKAGSNGAILVLSDGRKIELDSAGNSIMVMEGDTKVTGHKGMISYDGATNATASLVYNTLQTPKGRQFHLQLPDGTLVWLNAASSIRYPIAFASHTREVEITGEAYFEVAHLAQPINGGHKTAIPFIVHFTAPSGKTGQIEVLGTHFNINAYEDEGYVKTTLLEGMVKVGVGHEEVTMSVGEQTSVNKSDKIRTTDDIDTDAVIAWKNGYFSFNETDMTTLMRQIGRWYDVEIEYAGRVPDRKFGGEISRNSNASQVLKIMEASEVHFRIEGKKIIVLP